MGVPRICRRALVPVVAAALLGPVAGFSRAAAVELLSVGLRGVSEPGQSSGAALNGDGTTGVFYSDSPLIVSGDTNQARDVFVRDVATEQTERVSVSSSGEEADGASQARGGTPSLSADGQVVCFYSEATNLVDGDTNDVADVFLRRRDVDETVRVSVNSSGSSGEQANGASVLPSLSADGTVVAFQSSATNLVPNDQNGVTDVFVHDTATGQTERLCDVEPNRASSTAAISDDGNVVAFATGATNLSPADTNGKVDVYVCDRAAGTVELISVNSDGEIGNGDSILPALSEDGRYVGFKSLSTNLVADDRNAVVDVFLRDRDAGTTERISVDVRNDDADDFSFPPTLSDDGRFVAFASAATDIVTPDVNDSSDVFVRDRQIGFSRLVSVNDAGVQANGGTPDIAPSISGDGMKVGFVSFASNLDTRDENQDADAFAALNPFFGPGSCPDGVCPDGLVCDEMGFCSTPTPSPTPSRTATPTRTGTVTATPTVTPTFRPCENDDDCPDGQKCRGGFCREIRDCDPNDPAVDLLACFPRETCIDNMCECGGDCNLDGFVFGTEITRAIFVLVGERDLDACVAADINLDGQVMGNEITLAVLNLGEGCLQEGRPLLFAHDRGQEVTVALSSANDGDAVTVDVAVTGGGGDLATVQLDVLYDPSVLGLDDPYAACTKDARLDQHFLVAALPDDPPAPEGLRRLRLFVADTSLPIASFDDGPVVSCRFALLDAESGTTLGADRFNVGDDRGNTFRVRAESNEVEVPTPAPTPTVPAPPRPDCVGDCDGDRVVLGSEITRAVRIMGGEEPLQSCASADADGDGLVFITDITGAIINLGGGCPE